MASHLIFLVDDEPFVRQLLEHHVTSSWGHVARTFADAESALAALDESPDLIIMDIGLPGIGGVEALRRVRQHDPDLPVIMLSAQESVDVAVTTWKLGAHDYLTKPPDLLRLEASIRAGLYTRSLAKEVLRLREAVTRSGNFANIVTHDGRMHDILAHVQRVSNSDIAVLIQGESGTGKELIARAVHFNGKRKDGPFVVVNCASIPRELLESEMFGHEKGAFTGAVGRKIGKFEQANMGTIAEKDLPVSVQSFDTGGYDTGDLAHLFKGTEAIIPLERLREEAIRHALKVTGGNILHATRQLGVGRATFYRLMKRYGIPSDR